MILEETEHLLETIMGNRRNFDYVHPLPDFHGRKCDAVFHVRPENGFIATRISFPAVRSTWCVDCIQYEPVTEGLARRLVRGINEGFERVVHEPFSLGLPFEPEIPGFYWTRLDGDFILILRRRMRLVSPGADKPLKLKMTNEYVAEMESAASRLSEPWLLGEPGEGKTPEEALKKMFSSGPVFKDVHVIPFLSGETRTWMAGS